MTINFGEGERVTVRHKEGSLSSTIPHGRKGSRWDAACDVLESFILALAVAGASEKIVQEAAETTYEAMINNLE